MADLPISGLPEVTELDGTEEILLNQAGTSVKLDILGLTEYASGWVRDPDWLPMPADAANQACILTAVFDDSANYVAIRCSVSAGTYDVDWGDGTSDIGVTSNTNVNHLYSFADGDLGPVTAEGYKTAVITITPNTGGANITALDLGQKHNLSGFANGVAPWLDVQINAPSLTSFTFAGSNEPWMVQRLRFTAIGAVTSLSLQARHLEVCEFPTGSLGSLTSLSFQNCRNLRSFSFPATATALTSLSSTFRDCSALQYVNWPSALNSVTTMQNCFNGCASLKYITLPSLAACTNLQDAFAFCASIVGITFTALGNVTTISGAFNNCPMLRTLTLSSGDWGSLTVTTNFVTSGNVAKIVNCEFPITFTVANLRLGSAELDAIYTALPTIVGQTITVSGNFGISGDNPAIATGKGWTVTGS